MRDISNENNQKSVIFGICDSVGVFRNSLDLEGSMLQLIRIRQHDHIKSNLRLLRNTKLEGKHRKLQGFNGDPHLVVAFRQSNRQDSRGEFYDGRIS